MKRGTLLSVCLTVSILILGALTSPSTYAEEKGTAQALCPIMGGAIDKTAYVDYEGKRVYFCCPGCKSTFLKDPDSYVKKMESEGIVLEAAPTGKGNPGHTEKGHHGCRHHGTAHHPCECGRHS